MSNKTRTCLFLTLVAAAGALAAPAVADPDVTRDAFVPAIYQPPAALPSEAAKAPAPVRKWVLSAPPQESADQGEAIYTPIAAYLSRRLGVEVTYRHPHNWVGYADGIRAGAYDLVFDQPHLSDWRIAKHGYRALVKAAGEQRFVVFVGPQHDGLARISQLIGRTLCTQAPPDLGTLLVLQEFTNPMRQPAIVPLHEWDEAYSRVANGKCVAGVMPAALLEKRDTAQRRMRVLFQTRAMPGYALTASPRISMQDQARIAIALLAPDAAEATAGLRKTYAADKPLLPARNSEFLGSADLLRGEWGW